MAKSIIEGESVVFRVIYAPSDYKIFGAIIQETRQAANIIRLLGGQLILHSTAHGCGVRSDTTCAIGQSATNSFPRNPATPPRSNLALCTASNCERYDCQGFQDAGSVVPDCISFSLEMILHGGVSKYIASIRLSFGNAQQHRGIWQRQCRKCPPGCVHCSSITEESSDPALIQAQRERREDSSIAAPRGLRIRVPTSNIMGGQWLGKDRAKVLLRSARPKKVILVNWL